MNRTYRSLFVELGKYALITTVVVTGLVTSAAIASSQAFKAPTEGPLKAIGAQLAIKSPAVNVCPATAKMALWIQTNKPGPVSYMIAQKGGVVTGPYTVEAVKSATGGMASVSKNLQIEKAVDTEYRVLVSGADGKVMSQWVPLRASCKIQLGG
ncbi:MAG: hypothetical protein KDJ80_09240 [Nitratireductor sp.]|nr:hypothetical protein [Nitratireductor sp.]